MTPVGIHQRDREHWLAARQGYVCSSDVSAMLEKSEYKTRDQLRMEKAGLAQESFSAETLEKFELALELEPFIAHMAKKRFGWDLVPHGYLVNDADCASLAATPDFMLATPWGPAPVNVKTYMSKPFEQVKKHNGQLPLDYQLQAQGEMAVMGSPCHAMLVLHLTPLCLRAYGTLRHEPVIARIRREAGAFMNEVVQLREGKVA